MIAAHETPHAYHARMNSLIVHRASRTERLADELIERCIVIDPYNPLVPQTIVVPHTGMRRWLLQTIARHARARGGIAANFDTVLPWQWLQSTAKNVLGDEALVAGDYNTDALRWHVYHALPSSRTPAIENYVGGGDNERRRFQLAAHLADVFTQYLVYRSEMMLAWEKGERRAGLASRSLAPVRKQIDEQHRAQRKELLVAELSANGDGESRRFTYSASAICRRTFSNVCAPSRRIDVYMCISPIRAASIGTNCGKNAVCWRRPMRNRFISKSAIRCSRRRDAWVRIFRSRWTMPASIAMHSTKAKCRRRHRIFSTHCKRASASCNPTTFETQANRRRATRVCACTRATRDCENSKF